MIDKADNLLGTICPLQGRIKLTWEAASWRFFPAPKFTDTTVSSLSVVDIGIAQLAEDALKQKWLRMEMMMKMMKYG